MKRSRRQMSAAEREFKDRFDAEVLAKRPIVVDERKRRGIVDAHHCLPKSWLRQRVSRLEPEEGWAIVWASDNGIPVDRGRHDDITAAPDGRLTLAELAPFPEVIAFAVHHGYELRLRIEVPSWDGRSVTTTQETE